MDSSSNTRSTNKEKTQNLVANLDAATGSVTDAANPAAATSGLSQEPGRSRDFDSTTLFAQCQVVSLRQGAVDLDGRQMDRASETMWTLTYRDKFRVFRLRPG